ncbi:Ger(x)C family spore germination protein [Pullulanibacillus sp. KACC 23026]|uniref:Ger(x)C family spore germination protein n=1 Tax=Pullulanibacillus sp. KACC 23026 TaxID=3028315 RepID=UPI0023B12B3C|nr:Ger(x)C family spore germination protein [Pullulanibacillus sp. KACC 23026]WEG14372.1 Ger(x)C family spore germination protein [Pullulanibacillus sp. KACC 23026]
MTKRKLVLQLCTCILLVLVLSGCWDYRRLDQTATVIGFAIDPDDGHSFQITFQIPSMPGVLSGGTSDPSSESTEPPTTINIKVKSDTMGSAIAKAQEHLDRTLFFGNLQSIVLNEELTSDQTKEILTEVFRNSRIPNTASLFITPDSAEGILTSPEITDEPVSIFLRSRVRDVKTSGFERPIPLWVFFRDVYGYGISEVLPLVNLDQSKKLIFSGISVFNKYTWKGDLIEDEARGYSWGVSKVQKMQMVVQDSDHPTGVEVVRNHAHLSYRKINGRYQLYMVIKAEGNIVQNPTEGDQVITPQVLNRIQEETQKRIKEEVFSTFKKVQGWKVDPYGFGRLVMLHDSQLFRNDQLFTRWDDVFSDSDLHVTVNFKITGKGELT